MSAPKIRPVRMELPSLQGNREEGAIGERSDGGAKPGQGWGLKLPRAIRSHIKMSSKLEMKRQENWSKIGFPGLSILESDTRQIGICHPSFGPKQA